MNRNTLMAIVLIMATVVFFSSPTYQRFWYTKVLKKPYPENVNQTPYRQEAPTAAPRLAPESAQGAASAQKPGVTAQPAAMPATVNADTIWIETETMIAGISEVGARLVSLQMKEYRLRHSGKEKAGSSPFVDLLEKGGAGGAGLTVNNDTYDAILFRPEPVVPGNRITVKRGDSVALSLKTRDAMGHELTKRFIFEGDGYKVGCDVIDTMLNQSKIGVSWPDGIAESESQAGLYQSEVRAAHYSDGTDVEHIKSGKPSKDDVTGNYRWVGISSKYFLIAIVADSIRDADIKVIAFEDTNQEVVQSGKKANFKRINYSIAYDYTAEGREASFWFYAGPAKYQELKSFVLQFQKVMFPVLGWTKYFFWADKWFPLLTEFVLVVLLFLYGLVKDYGIAILLLTLLSRLITYPLTQSSMKSMNRMKDLQPKINALREKHKNNPRKMNAEVMALYKAEGVNPLNPGCLPMFLQMPIFIALYVALGKAIELRGAGTVLLPWIHDLSQPESVFSFASIIPGGIPFYGSSFAILPVVMAVLTFVQNKMTIKDPNQKMMIYFMPIFMLALFNNFASGLVLYWTLSSGLGLVQQYYTGKQQAKRIPDVAPPLRSIVHKKDSSGRRR